jgi:hypothetical protein
MILRLPVPVVTLAGCLLSAACGPDTGDAFETNPSTSTTTSGGETSSTGTMVSASSTVAGSSSTVADDSSTGSSEPAEYVGFYESSFGFVSFTACGEDEPWDTQGLPAYGVCEAGPLYLRVLGVMQPPLEGSATPVLAALEILEGPCRGGSCDGSVELGECASFDALCSESTSFECSVFDQDCAFDEKCMPWANDGGMEWNATRCAPVVPMPGQPGDPCLVETSPFAGVDDCERGAMCWNVDPDTLQGECAALCDQTLMPDPACPAETTCMPFFAMGVELLEPIGVCLP